MLFYTLLIFLIGCDLVDPKAGTSLQQIKCSTDTINQPTTLIVCDIVAIFDLTLADKFKKMKALDYFKEIENIHSLNNNFLCVWRFEQLPQQSKIIKLEMAKSVCKPHLVMLFADYRSKGEHSAVIPRNIKQLDVIFGLDKISKINYQTNIKGKPTYKLYPCSKLDNMNLS